MRRRQEYATFFPSRLMSPGCCRGLKKPSLAEGPRGTCKRNGQTSAVPALITVNGGEVVELPD